MKKWITVLLVLLLVVSLTACGDQEIQGEDPVVSEEQNSDRLFEGTTLELLVAYGGAENAFDAFMEATGIEIEWMSMSTGAALSKLQAEDGKTTADVWFGGGVDSYLNARDLGYLEPYKSPELSAINPQYIDEDGYFAGLALVPAGFIVNEDLLEELGLEAPKTWQDLTDPKYKGEIIMADPAISGTQYAIVSGTIQELGEDEAWSYFQELDKNIDFYAKGGGEPQQKVAAGEFAIGVTAIHGRTFNIGETSPTREVFAEDFIPWTPAPVAIFKNTDNLEAAKALVDWFLSREGQEILKEADARIMARDDVDPPEEMSGLDRSKLLDFDLERMGREREDILNEWEELIGDR